MASRLLPVPVCITLCRRSRPNPEYPSNHIRIKAGSFLAVIKTFDNIESPGLLSFPRPGVTVALDFPNNGQQTRLLFKELDKVVWTMEDASIQQKMLAWISRRLNAAT